MKTVSRLPKRAAMHDKPSKLYCCLRSLRQKYGLPLREVAKHSGVSHPTLARMEAGKECCLSHAIRVADFFETTVEKIWNTKEKAG
jgi:DNA-binding XRE family transcriptional regulator